MFIKPVLGEALQHYDKYKTPRCTKIFKTASTMAQMMSSDRKDWSELEGGGEELIICGQRLWGRLVCSFGIHKLHIYFLFLIVIHNIYLYIIIYL